MAEKKVLDLADVLSGSGLPTKEVPVIFNESLGYQVYALEQAMKQAELSDDTKALAKVKKEFDKVLKEIKANQYIITVKAAPEQIKANIREEVLAKFPEEVDMLGRTKPNPKSDAAFLQAMWQAHIVEITGPDGASKMVDENEVLTMYNMTGGHVHNAINTAIQDLAAGTSEGFEVAFKELDFL